MGSGEGRDNGDYDNSDDDNTSDERKKSPSHRLNPTVGSNSKDLHPRTLIAAAVVIAAVAIVFSVAFALVFAVVYAVVPLVVFVAILVVSNFTQCLLLFSLCGG